MESEPSNSAWQAKCTEKLIDAVAAGRHGSAAWEAFRSSTPALQRIVIGPANFDGQSLLGFDLSRCYFTRVSFKSANLSKADFSQSIFRECDATSANIEGTNFRDADMKIRGLILSRVRFDDETAFEVAPALLPDELPQGLVDVSVRLRSKRRWRTSKAHSRPVRYMLWLTEHGFSFRRLAIAGMAVVIGFAAIFAFDGNGFTAALLESAAYFLNANTAHGPGLFLALGLIEALLGMLFFAVLTALLVSVLFDNN